MQKYTRSNFRFCVKREWICKGLAISAGPFFVLSFSPSKALASERISETGIHEILSETEDVSSLHAGADVLYMDFSDKAAALKGKVVDGNGAPLAGVTIRVKGSDQGAITNSEGEFELDVSPDAVLEVSFIGFQNQEVQLDGKSEIRIVLQPSSSALNELVVVGYGTQKKADVTGAISTVPQSRLTDIPVTNVMHALEGSTAGLSVTQNSTVPGKTAGIQIRGLNSITAGTSPLIIVDGLPLGDDASTNDINPNDIESISVLKDASAVAIYGVRGSNGVILITTKRGGDGKPTIKYNVYGGFENLAHKLKPSSPEQYIQQWADYKAETNDPDTSVLRNAFERNNYYAGNPPVDWLDLTTQQGFIQNHNLSVSGGTKDVKYYISGEYMKEKGVVRGYQYQRASVRSNLDVNVTKFLTIGTSLFYTNNNTDGGRANFFFGSLLSPYGTVYNANGGFEIWPEYPETLYENPLLGLTTDRLDRSQNFNGNGYAEVKFGGILDGLKFRANVGYTFIPTRTGSYTGRLANDNTGTANTFHSESKNWIVENILSYTRELGKHHIDFTGLYSAQRKDYFAMAENSQGFFNDVLSFYNLGAGNTISAGNIFGSFNGSYRDVKSELSQMGRVNYNYDSRYLFTFTVRRDGSSVFGANTNKYGVFPSVALGWNIMEENFMKELSFLDNLKLRLSYGKTGNEAISINQTKTTANAVGYPFTGARKVGILASNLGNSDLHWETTKGLNAGLDFSVIRNRISGSVDFYRTRTSDLILSRKIPSISGYGSILDNLGTVQNQGVEITLNTVNIHTGNFKWESNINFSSYRNKIVKLYGNLDSLGNEISDIGNRWFIGEPVQVIYDYKMIGVWQEDEDHAVDPGAKPGYLKFQDVNGDGKIDANDMIIQGSPLPKWSGGITNTFKYKNWHLNIFIQTIQGIKKNNNTLNFADEAYRLNLPEEIRYWTPENKSQTRPSLDPNARAAARGYGYPSNGSFTRIKDVTLSYEFPQQTLEKIGIAGLTLYVSGRNLHTFTNWIGWDPELNYDFRGSGDWTNNYPLNRTIVFGANITLR